VTTRIAVSLPDELVMAARQAVAEGRANSVSAFVAEALREHSHNEDLANVLSDMAERAGPPSADDRAWARRALGLT
jgi:Arc/MetJ-type ribon-helix-helix transcriptional regulator